MSINPIDSSLSLPALINENKGKADKPDFAQTLAKTSTALSKSSEDFLQKFLNFRSTSNKPEFSQMQTRLADIQYKGRLLREHPLPNLIKDYISDVKDFLQDARDHAYKGDFKENIFEKISVADKELDGIAKKLLEQEKEAFGLVHSLGRLEGLLIDIFV